MNADQIGRIGHVALMQEESDALAVGVLVEMIDARGVERLGAPLDAVNDIALAEQQFGEISAVLAGGSGNQCNTIRHPRCPSGFRSRRPPQQRAKSAGLRAKGFG